MRTVKTKVYKFKELSEDAKQKAIEEFADINVNYDWWSYTYEDAKRIGLKITEFDLDRNRHCKGEFIEDVLSTSAKIVQEHGKDCETHKDALQFGIDYDVLVEKYSNGFDKTRVAEDNEYEFDNEADELEQEFLKTILEDYSIMLQHAYEYLTSAEAIIESIEANEYEFLETGKLY